MKILVLSIASICLMFSISCNETHFISDTREWTMVQKDFEARRKALNNEELFKAFDKKLSLQQKEALTFLYAYMPLGDITDYLGDYFLENIDYAFKARDEMPWGNKIPEREFRHFVLPIRVNNENLDSSRKVFYEALKNRVQHLSLYDAVLEVNHWCHEKVAYTPSDTRTSSPLASVKSAYGRCGEESTFTVAALRAVGIPARQVYTPRWAHTNDNHAWVEAWIDGKWCFLGACEPEPVLNLGWFNAPASRGMLMHTKVFGSYNGHEEVMYRTPTYTEINVIDNYAPTAKCSIIILDIDGNPVPDAKVEFKVYNYAEFYTVATKKTDAQGKTFLTAGKGDMLIWISKDGKFGYSKASFGNDDSLTIILDKKETHFNKITEINIIPPPEAAKIPEVTSEQRTNNTHRMEVEDSIRNAYVATFISEKSARSIAHQHRLDENAFSKLLIAARGNYQVIEEFIATLTSDSLRKNAIQLLQAISAKDLRDVTLEVLQDHIQSRFYKNATYFNAYILNPRISNEMLTPYKSFFNKVIAEDNINEYCNNPLSLVAWVKDHIRIDKDCNLGGAPISPKGVWKARIADPHSRDIFFVAVARSLGIPAYIDEVTGKVKLITNGDIIDINFETSQPQKTITGKLFVNYTSKKSLQDPKYYTHFTISKLTPQGSLQLLKYDEGDIDMGGGATWQNYFRKGIDLDSGNYVLVTGTRLANGNVLSNMNFFTIKPHLSTTVDLVMRESTNDIEIVGNFNSESTYQSVESKHLTSILATTGRGYFIVAVLGVGQEPTNHALRDIATLGNDFQQWDRPIILLFPDEYQYRKFNPQEFHGLPSNITYGIDINNAIQKQIVENMKLANTNSLPLFIIADTFNHAIFVSQGYTIGLGEQMMKIIHKLQ